MVKREFSDHQLKAHVLEFLRRQERWGAHYFPLDTLVHWISKAMKRDGKRVRNAVRELVKDRYVLIYKKDKKGNTISLNPKLAQEINEFIAKNLED